MASIESLRKEVLEGIVERNRDLGKKRYYSETNLYHVPGEDPTEIKEDNDPGVLNPGLGDELQDSFRKRKTVSQPGPVGGSTTTALAARALRRKPRTYAAPPPTSSQDDDIMSRLQMPSGLRSNDSGAATPIGDKNIAPPYATLNGVSNRLYASNMDLRQLGTPRKRSVVTLDALSLRSTETHAPPPTTPQEKKKVTKQYLTLILSSIYAIFLVTLGLIIFIGDPFLDISISPIFCVVQCTIGLLYQIYLTIDVRLYLNKVLKNQRIKEEHGEAYEEYFKNQEIHLEGFENGEVYQTPLPPLPPVMRKPSHDYCIIQGRHAGSFYLKLGAAGFALGHLVHSVLLMTTQIVLILDENLDNDECVDYGELILYFVYPVYSFFQLYFIFKYSNLVILRRQVLAKFAFMHFVGSSLCFWMFTIVRETLLGLTIYAMSRRNRYNNTDTDSYESESNESELMNQNNIATTLASHVLLRFINVDNLINEECLGDKSMATIFENFSPYLYPFTVEYNILIVGIFYIVWNNIGRCPNEDDNADTLTIGDMDDDNTECKIPTASEDNSYSSNFVIHADCHASNKGVFAGMVAIVIIFGVIILGFVFASTEIESLSRTTYVMQDSTRLALHTAMLGAVIIAYNQIRQLDINQHPISLLDDVLLFICLPAFFMETFFTTVATIAILNVVKCVDTIIMTLQMVLQTAFIADGLRRCSNTRKLRRTKPGREIVMFLLIANVGVWLSYTFSYKSPDSLDERYEFYGKVLWTILGHISLPLIMFYRFHSSVCLADIWNSAYKPGSEH